MSLNRLILRKTGIYERMQAHFYEGMLVPFATEGTLNLAERIALGEQTRNLSTLAPIIEIGTLFGKSTNVLLENKKIGQKVITVDRFTWNPCGITREQHKNITRKILSDVSRQDLEIVDAHKDEFFESYTGPAPAMVFIDADHSYDGTLKDIVAAQRLNTEVICGHDYCDEMPGVKRAVNDSGGISLLIESFWVLQIRGPQ